MDQEEHEHILNIGTSIICTKYEVGYPGGSFVQSLVNNDLQATFATADSVNRDCIYFYIMMLNNMPLTILK